MRTGTTQLHWAYLSWTAVAFSSFSPVAAENKGSLCAALVGGKFRINEHFPRDVVLTCWVHSCRRPANQFLRQDFNKDWVTSWRITFEAAGVGCLLFGVMSWPSESQREARPGSQALSVIKPKCTSQENITADFLSHIPSHQETQQALKSTWLWIWKDTFYMQYFEDNLKMMVSSI